MLVLPPSWVFGVSGGTGDPPDSSDGVLDKNRLPPSSETSVIGELQLLFFFGKIFVFFVFVSVKFSWQTFSEEKKEFEWLKY